MTANNTQTQLNQKLDQLPSGILQPVVDFVDFLLYRQSRDLALANEPETKLKSLNGFSNSQSDLKVDGNVRPAKGNRLLELESGWAGDDFEEGLQSVYDTRSQIKA